MTPEEYDAKIHQMRVLMADDPDPLSEEGKLLLQLVAEIEIYEAEHFPLDEGPVEDTEVEDCAV
jgi:hypothetical protein